MNNSWENGRGENTMGPVRERERRDTLTISSYSFSDAYSIVSLILSRCGCR